MLYSIRVGVRIRFSVWLVSGYAFVFFTTFRCYCHSLIFDYVVASVAPTTVDADDRWHAASRDIALKTSLTALLTCCSVVRQYTYYTVVSLTQYPHQSSVTP